MGLLTATPTVASIPTGQHFGVWHVSSITSISGDGRNGEGDAAAMMVQQQNCTKDDGGCDELTLGWDQGDNVRISISVKDCRGDNEDFEQNYSVPLAHWMKAGRAVEKRVETDFNAWLGQAALACDTADKVKAFDMKQLRLAIGNFTARLRELSGQ